MIIINHYYRMFEDDLFSPTTGKHKSYGIEICDASDENHTVIQRIEDVSIYKEHIENLVILFNDLALDPIHIYEVIDNELY